MTAKGKPVRKPEREIDLDKDKFTLSTSENDHDFQIIQGVGNKIESLQKKVTAKSSYDRTEKQVIFIGNTRTFCEEYSLEKDYIDKDNGQPSFIDSRITLVTVDNNRKRSYHAKSSGKCSTDRGISKRLQLSKKTGAANRKPFVILHKLSIAYMIISMLNAETVVCSNTVKWEVKTKPILFGETLELLCKILDKDNVCKGSFQQWYGSKANILLCQNGKCRNEEKYTVKRNANCSYSLLIHNLSISDVDISYSCAFGINEMKKGLMMQDYEFLKLPRNSSVIPLVTTNGSIVDVLLKMDGIYPVPKCNVKLKKEHERDITNMADIFFNVTQNGIFYTYTMHIMHNVSKLECGSLLTIHCLIGSVIVTDLSKELNNHDNCTHHNSNTLEDNNMALVVIYVIVICVVAIGVVLISVRIYHKRKKRRRYQAREKQQSEMVLESTRENGSLQDIDSEDIDQLRGAFCNDMSKGMN